MDRPRARGGALSAAGRRTGALVLALSLPAASACSAGNGSSAGAVSVESPTRTGAATTVAATPSPAPAGSYGLGRYQPLWPFDSVDAARAWQGSYRSGGHAPWHLSADETALAFVRFLDLKGIDRVTRRTVSAGEARVGVGHGGSEGGTATAAVIHLIRLGDGAEAPWEVVGTDDKELTLTTPAYGATVSSPVTVGGAVTGVDESLRVAVHQPSTGPSAIGSFCCVPAGGFPGRWSAKVPFHGATDRVLTIVVSTGGHVAEVERFGVTGVRTR